MAGVDVPEFIITRPYGNEGLGPTAPGGATLPIPVDSQVGVLVGAASFTDGFPAATMVDPETEGGVPPYGQDMNGILYMLSAYCALLQAGQLCEWNDDAQTAFGGYAIGATLESVSTPGLKWTNVVDGNTADPDSDPTGWSANIPQYDAVALSGTQDNYVLPGASDFAIDVDTTGGACTFTGFIAQRDGQKLFITCTGANLLQVNTLDGGSDAANQVRTVADLGVVENQTLTLQYFAGITKWLAV